ncbi:putative quinol monooxygenase [Streptomyces sparsus]
MSGRLRVDPGERSAYLTGCRRVVEQARETPGCLDFVLAADPIEPGRINVYEQWESDDALARFRGGGPEPERSAALLDAQVWKHRVSAVEPP